MNRSRSVLVSALVSLAVCATPLRANAGDAGSTANSTGGQKRALLIGISQYDPTNKGVVPNLNTSEDIAAIKNVLETKFQFKDKDIKVLTDKQATHQGILDEFNKLIDATNRDDIVYFHFSGHGSRTVDPDHATKPDAALETIVPVDYDFNLPVDKYDNEITEKELAPLVQKLSDRNPKLATLTFDCCYSGSISRERAFNQPPTRGFESPNLTKLKSKNQSRAVGDSASTAAPEHELIRNPRPGVIVLSAARSTQTATEWPPDSPKMGLFSHALTQAMLKVTPNQTTYRELLDDIRGSMTRDGYQAQDPQSDGSLKALVMNGDAVPVETAIDAEKQNDKFGSISLNAGQLQGMTVGSKFSLYSNDTKGNFKNTKELATAEVSDVDTLSSGLRIVSGDNNLVSLKPHDHLKAVETEHAYDDDALKVSIEGVDEPLHKHIVEAVKGAGLTLVDANSGSGTARAAKDAPDIKILKDSDKKGIVVIRGDGTDFFKFQPSPEGSKESASELDRLKQSLRDEMTWRFVKKMSNPATERAMAVKVRVIPVDVVRNSRGRATKITPRAVPDGQLTLTEGDEYQVEVTNAGDQPVFVNVVEIECNGKIAGLLTPGAGESQTTFAADGKPHVIPSVWKEQGPFGKELIKVIATTSEADFKPIVTDTSGETRAFETKSNNPLARMLQRVATSGKTRAPGVSSVPDEYAVADFPMETKQKPPETKQVNNAAPAQGTN